MSSLHYLGDMELDKRLRLRHLRCFLEIARVGSLGAAAGNLGVTQPAASKTLKELEEILGRQLFDRSGWRLKLNSAGRMFQQFAGLGVAELVRAQEAVRRAQPEAVKLAVGVLPTAATDLLPRAAVAMRETNPSCVLRVSTGPNWLLHSQLKEASLDLVVGRMATPELMDGLSFEQLYLETATAVVRADHPLRAGDDLRRLADYPLILPPRGALIWPYVRGFLTSIGVEAAEPAFETVSLAFGRRVLLLSDAVWFISRGVVAEELALGSLRALDPPHPMLTGPVGVSLRKDAHMSEHMIALLHALRAAARDIAGADAARR
ncbi:MAG: LysR substrate-binding domain-containing protein [Neomegalonema sp.]|nr:LysR substrate-binding domain-containing protein [Neomegalonema sp.]